VGEWADEQATDLMRQCAEEIEKHFGQLGCNIKRRSQHDATKDKYGWWVELWLWPKPGRNRKMWTVGVSVEESGEGHESSPAIFLYLWTDGGKRAEEKLTRLLGNKTEYQSAHFDWYAGSVFIGKGIPLRVNRQDAFEIDRDILIEELWKRLRKLERRDAQRLFKIQAT
jgi:hypothetical protein